MGIGAAAPSGLNTAFMPPLVPACRFSALSIAPAARSWLMHTRRACVLHIFDRACNLINDRGKVLSVVAGEIGNGPFNIVVESTHQILLWGSGFWRLVEIGLVESARLRGVEALHLHPPSPGCHHDRHIY